MARRTPAVIEADFGPQDSGGSSSTNPAWVAALDKLVKAKFPPLTQGPVEPGRANLRGMCIGEQLSNGMPTGKKVIKVFVGQKTSPDNVDPNFLFSEPQIVNGEEIPFDVEELVEIYTSPPQVFTPKFGVELPPMVGSCIGNRRTTDTGTLGCLVLDRAGHLCILSNNHVMGGSNAGQVLERDSQGKVVKEGDVIEAPGSATQFPDRVQVGVLHRVAPLKFDGAENVVDGALAATGFKVASPKLHASDFTISPQMQNDPRIGMVVYKEGARTGSTFGIIVGVHGALDIPYAPGGVKKIARFVRQLVIVGIVGPFSQPGDSGSLVLERETKRPVGLVFAGGKSGDGQDYTFANHIVDVKNELEIERFIDKVIPTS